MEIRSLNIVFSSPFLINIITQIEESDQMKRKCQRSGCAAICSINDVYCPDHKRVSAPRRVFDSSWIYKTSRWIRISKAIRNEFPICQKCMKSPTDVVDHIYELRWLNGQDHAYTLDNLMAVCHTCHNIKTKAIARTIRINQDGIHQPTNQTYNYLSQYCATMDQLAHLETTRKPSQESATVK